ncbi:MAG: hypothetical protein CMH79_04750 [Nitrospinae bacterium]|nr:hypothetical protein [Nitrospinota bacterium]
MVIPGIKNERIVDIVHYKIAERIRKLIFYKNHPNIILHGTHKSGKTKIINTVLNEIYGPPTRNIKNEKISFKENPFYYHFNCNSIINKSYFIDFIKEISLRFDHYNDLKKYIILDNYNKLSIFIQNSLKVIFEKSYNNAHFIIISNNINNIDISIKSSSLMIRVPLPTKYDKYIYLKDLFLRYDIEYNDFLLLIDCQKYDLDILIRIYYYGYQSIDKLDDMVNNLNQIYKSKLNIQKIKDISCEIKNININIPELFHKYIDQLIQSEQNINKIIVIIKEIAEYNYIINISYRDIIPLESLLIKLYFHNNYD